jgi:ribosomal-protein-alanine N-acetyltransferase
VKIRTLTHQDASQMADIHKASFPVGWPDSDMVQHIQKDLCLCVFDPDTSLVIAFALFQIGGDQADVLTIATAPEHRRKGCARLLLDASEQALKEQRVKTLYLDVSEKNEGAIILYKSCGYHPIGRRPAYYRTSAGRVAALTFSKSLTNE